MGEWPLRQWCCLCWCGHWVTLVARIGDKPLMVAINSIGGGPSEPVEATMLCNFLLSLCGWTEHEFNIVIPNVPEQPNWTDCRLFTMQYIDEIIVNPDRFIQMAAKPGASKLKNWFPYSEMKKKRCNVAAQVRRLAVEHHKQCGPLQKMALQTSDIDLDEVRFEYSIVKIM